MTARRNTTRRNTTRRNTTRRNTTRRTLTVVAVLVSGAGLVACGGQPSPATEQTVRPGLNRMEHEAHRQLAEVREQQSQALNPREHLAQRGLGDTAPTACSAALARAWQRLGHYSDGYERYLVRTLAHYGCPVRSAG